MPSGLISATQQEKQKQKHDTRDIQNINKHYQFLRIVLLLISPSSMHMHRLTDVHARALSVALWVIHAPLLLGLVVAHLQTYTSISPGM